jgi:hypothetical protein
VPVTGTSPPARQPAPTPAATATPNAPAPTPPSPCAREDPHAPGQCEVPSTACTVFGTDGDDLLIGTPFHDVVCGFGGDDQFEGGDGNDTLLGGTGDDVMIGGEGVDCMLGGPGVNSADAGLVSEARSADSEPLEIDLNAQGDCIRFASPTAPVTRRTPPNVVGYPTPTPPPRVTSARSVVGLPAAVATPAPVASAATANQAFVGSLIALSGGRLTVRDGAVRVRVRCSAPVSAELVIVASARRIAHKRFTCNTSRTGVRVRLTKAGRTLVARDDRVDARVLILAAGRTTARRVRLVSRG